MDNNQKLEQLKQKYQSVLNAIEQQGVRLHNLHIQDGKLFLRGDAPSEEAKNRVWDQIKLVDSSYADLTADITVAAGASSGSAERVQTAGMSATGGQSSRTYTVQKGDTLSKIAKQFYGNASQYNRIFEANRDTLSDPDKIRPGQQLTIPE